MKQSLQLKIGQSLTMTPQLQQAIRLLQLSTMELQQEIQQTLESNPLLELEEEFEESPVDADAETTLAEELTDSLDLTGLEDAPSAEMTGELNEFEDIAGVTDYDGDIPDDIPVDSTWDDLPAANTSPGAGESTIDFEARNSADTTLTDHLLWQLNLTPMSDRDQVIALAIIDAIHPDGLLMMSLEDICSGFDPLLDIELDEVEAVLHRLQHFDPLGVAARDLADCLAIQLRALPENLAWRKEALALVTEHLDILGAKDFANLRRKTRLGDAELSQVVSLIQSLNPRPGSSIGGGAAAYVVPDVQVRKVAGVWQVTLNGESIPKVRINQTYAGMIKRADSSSDNQLSLIHISEPTRPY